MTLQELSTRRQRLGGAPPARGVVDCRSGSGSRARSRAANPAVLTEIRDRLLEAAINANCSTVSGASRLGDQLAGAVSAASGGRLGLWAHNGASGSVMIIEGVLATGTQLVGMGHLAREAGADRVVPAAVFADPSAEHFVRAELGSDVVVLEHV